MPTFITVIEVGGPSDPYLAVQGCNFREPLENSDYYNSQFSQSFSKRVSDLSIGTKWVTNIRTGHRVSATMFALSATLPISDEIKVPGCDHTAALGFSTHVQNFVAEWNALEKAKLKLKADKKKFKDSK